MNEQLFEVNSIIRIYFEHKFCAKQNNVQGFSYCASSCCRS